MTIKRFSCLKGDFYFTYFYRGAQSLNRPTSSYLGGSPPPAAAPWRPGPCRLGRRHGRSFTPRCGAALRTELEAPGRPFLTGPYEGLPEQQREPAAEGARPDRLPRPPHLPAAGRRPPSSAALGCRCPSGRSCRRAYPSSAPATRAPAAPPRASLEGPTSPGRARARCPAPPPASLEGPTGPGQGCRQSRRGAREQRLLQEEGPEHPQQACFCPAGELPQQQPLQTVCTDVCCRKKGKNIFLRERLLLAFSGVTAAAYATAQISYSP